LTSLRSGSNPSEKIPKGSLKFIAGDIISCAIEPARLGSHMMLAVSEHHVMHIPGKSVHNYRFKKNTFVNNSHLSSLRKQFC